MPQQYLDTISNGSDDISTMYLDDRQLLAQSTAGAELLQRFGRPAETAAEGGSKGGGEAPKVPAPTGTVEGGVAAKAGAIASDIGQGVIESPNAAIAGVREAYQSAIDMAASAGDWLEQEMDLPVITLGKDGVGIESAREFKGKRVADYMNIPELPEGMEPESNTGKLVKGVAQFLTGFKTTGKLLGGAAPAGKAGAALKGAITDFTFFDGQQGRLSDLIESNPALQNPVTAYLASDANDSEAEGRFKNAVEGLGLGVLVDGLGMAVKSLRNAAAAKRAQTDAARIAGGAELPRPEIADDAFDGLGKAGDELVTTPKAPQGPDVPPPSPTPTPEPPKSFGDKLRAAEAQQGGAIDPASIAAPKQPAETYINFARIDTPDDIKNVMQNMADAHKGSIDAARRGEKQTFRQVQLNAEQVNAWDTLMSRRVGEPLNAEQSVAARQLWASSADKLAQTARAAASNPSESNLFAFRKMMTVHQAIQNEVIAARTETARALASWRIPAGSGAERFMQVDNALIAAGGPDLSREMAQRVATLADNGMVHEAEAFVAKGAFAKSRDAMLEAWINGLLSGPKTHLVNMMSNTSVVFQQMYERNVAAKIANALGDEGSVQLGEAMQQWFGMVNALPDAFRYMGKAFITGQSGFGLGKVDLPMDSAISSEALGIASSGWLGRTVDTLGTAARVPTRALAAQDEFFKTIGYRMELNALALRQATQEINAGIHPPEFLKARVADIVQNPPSSLKLAAIDQAAYQTFTNAPGELTKSISKIVNNYPVMRVILPFVRTPSNIMKYTFQRTPLAPLMKEVRADIAAGGARRDLTLARIGTGTAIMFSAADLAMSEHITGNGPANSAERQALTRTGWQPYSVKVGDRYYAYNRLDPLGMTLGLAADMTEILSNDEYGVEKQKTAEEAAIAMAMAIGQNSMSKTYLSGLSEFFEAMADPQRYGDSFFQGLAGSAVPTISSEVARANDPYMREVQSMLDAMRKRTPGLSEGLPVRRDLWGEPVSYQSGLGTAYDMFSPIYSRADKRSPIDEEILRLETSITMPDKKTSFDGVTINLERYPEAYSRYVQLAGNELKHPAWKLGARDYLNKLVTGKHTLSQVYNMRSDGPDGGKSDMIKKTINDYREMARQQLLKEFPELKAEFDEKQRQKRQLKMPTVGRNEVAYAQ